jgi:hypothetical protein
MGILLVYYSGSVCLSGLHVDRHSELKSQFEATIPVSLLVHAPRNADALVYACQSGNASSSCPLVVSYSNSWIDLCCPPSLRNDIGKASVTFSLVIAGLVS